MNSQQSANQRQGEETESSSRTANSSEADKARDRRSVPPTSHEEKVSLVNQYVTLISSIVSILPTSVLTFTIAIQGNFNGFLVWTIVVISGLAMAALIFSTVYVCQNFRKQDKLSLRTEDVPFRGEFFEKEDFTEKKDAALININVSLQEYSNEKKLAKAQPGRKAINLLEAFLGRKDPER